MSLKAVGAVGAGKVIIYQTLTPGVLEEAAATS